MLIYTIMLDAVKINEMILVYILLSPPNKIVVSTALAVTPSTVSLN